MSEKIGNLGEIVVGDRAILVDKMFSGETQKIPAAVIETRRIHGKLAYVVETEKGTRKVVGESRISKIESSK